MAEYFNLLNLQLFADGGDGGGTGTSAGQSSTADSGFASADNGVKNGSSFAEMTETPDREAEFEKLIKGEYKDLYDKRMQDTIQKRLKSTKDTVDRYEKLAPTLDLLTHKYGVEADDLDGLTKAIEEDSTFYEEEALERGVSVEQLKYIKKLERENAEVKKQMQAEENKKNADALYQRWMTGADETKSVYPSFDLNTEMQNQQFVQLLRSGIDVRTAYEVCHKDDIIRGAMAFTAQKVGQKVAAKVAANGSRPAENGMNSASASLTKADVSQLTRAERDELCRRALRGEKITF